MVIVEKYLFFGIYDELNFLWTIHCKLSLDWKDQSLALYLQPRHADRKYFLHCTFVNTIRDFNQYKAHFHAFKFSSFQCFICENSKLPFLWLKHLFEHLRKNLKWTAMRHSQMVNVALYFHPCSLKHENHCCWIFFYFFLSLYRCIVIFCMPEVILESVYWNE